MNVNVLLKSNLLVYVTTTLIQFLPLNWIEIYLIPVSGHIVAIASPCWVSIWWLSYASLKCCCRVALFSQGASTHISRALKCRCHCISALVATSSGKRWWPLKDLQSHWRHHAGNWDRLLPLRPAWGTLSSGCNTKFIDQRESMDLLSSACPCAIITQISSSWRVLSPNEAATRYWLSGCAIDEAARKIKRHRQLLVT
jgi:hypothetical protein